MDLFILILERERGVLDNWNWKGLFSVTGILLLNIHTSILGFGMRFRE